MKTLRRLTWLWVGVIATFGVASAAPLDLPVPPMFRAADPPTIQLVVLGAVGFEDEFLAIVGMELSEILRPLGVHLIWSTEGSVDRVGEENGRRLDASSIHEPFWIVFAKKSPSEWGVKRRAMGITVRGARRLIIFSKRVLYILDSRQQSCCLPAARHTPEAARAFARVAAHELVHALAPEHSHAARGLMRGSLTRQHLLAEELPVDPECRAALALALRSAGGPDPNCAAARAAAWSLNPRVAHYTM